MFHKEAKDQHYISVSEQKLNSINPNETDRKKIKIYSFKLIDRETHKIELCNPSLVKAIKNLYYTDLYTFEILDKNQRLCFENLFERLERKVASQTNKILDNDEFTVGDFLDVIKTKFLNMIRNPYCIKFTLNNFSAIKDLYPKDTDLNSKFKKIEALKVSSEILEKFLVTESDYKDWLKIIFLMITPLNKNRYILDDVVENFFNLEKFYHLIYLCKFTNKTCLLSDRGYVNLSELFENSDGMSFGFNLRHDSFIYLTFFPNDLVKIAKDIIGLSGENIARILKEKGVTQIQTGLSIQLSIDNLELLKSYNKHVIYQCFNNVFAAKPEILK